MKIKNDMKDLGTFYFGNKIMKDARGWWIYNGNCYEPWMQYLWGSWLTGATLLVILIVLAFLKAGQ